MTSTPSRARPARRPASARPRAAAAIAAAAVLLAGVGCAGRRAPARPDVLLLTVDSLRADRPGFMGGKVETPAMDALASAGVAFTQAISPVPQTLPSLVSLHTGAYPPAHGVRDDGRDRLGEGRETLATIFKKAGYRTAAFAAAMSLHPKHGLDRGFDTYAEAFADVPRPRTSLVIGHPAARVADHAIEWLEVLPQGDRFFLWVNFFDPHFFYEPPSPFKERYAEQPYDGEVALVDREIGRLMKWLADHGRDASTLVVLAGNHGEGLGDGGEQYHGILLREPTLRVPLVVRLPAEGGAAAPASARVEDPVSLVDVAPTIADLAGIGGPAGMDGLSLGGYLGRGARPDAGRAIYFETLLPRTLFGWAPLRGVRSGSLKYVEAPGAGKAELYDLASDPVEASDLSASRPEEARRLAAEAARLGPDVTSAPDAPGAEAAAAIKSLGFSATPQPVKPVVPSERLAAGNAALQAHRSMQRGMMQTAAFLFQDVMRTDPENYLSLVDFGAMNVGARNFAGGEMLLRKAQSLYPADGELYHVLGHVTLVTATAPDAAAQDRARRLFQTAVLLDPLNEEALYDVACALAATDSSAALDSLERAIRNGFRDYKHMSRDRDLDPLRGLARFTEITGGRAVTEPPPAAPASAPSR